MMPLTVAAVGDILIDRPEPLSALAAGAAAFNTADITFGNFEGVLTDCHRALPGRTGGTIVRTSNAAGVRGFDVLSLANNHTLDAGYDGLNDTIAALQSVGANTVGAGRTPSEAWKPVTLRAGGRSVAFIAVTSVLRVGYEARGQRGGVASLIAVDHYAPRFPAAYVPGVPPHIVSVADKDDWRRLEQAIAAAKTQADFVIVSMHWGDHTRPHVITDFERETAKRLSDLSVDLVLGHHQHRLRGVEFFGDMPVLYGLGHIVFDQPRYADELRSKGADWLHLSEAELERRFGRYGNFPRPSGFLFDETARWSVIAVTELAANTRPNVGYIPMHIGMDGTAHAVPRRSPQWNEFLDLMSECIRDGGLNSRVTDDGRSIGDLPVLSVQPAE